MADNVVLNAGAGGATAAADEATYSGDVAKIQLVRLVHVSGAEGAKSVSELIGTAGSPGTAVVTVQGVASGTVIPVADGGGSLTVDNAALSVTGGGVEASAMRVTLASDSTGVLSVDDNGGSLTVDNAGLTSLNGAISGTEVQVDVVASLPAGTNNIGDVDVLSVVPGTGATSLGKAIDAASGANDTGVAMLAIRDDALAALTPVEGDYVPLRVSSTGALHVTGAAGTTQYAVDAAAGAADSVCVAGVVRDDALSALTPADGDYTTLRVTSTGALWVANAGASSVFTDDAVFTPGTSSVSVIGAQADEASTDSVDEGDAGAVRMTLDRKLITTPQPHTAGGLSIFRSLDLDETEEEAKASAGCVYGMWVTNTATATRFIKFYNATAANVTVGTTTPVITIGIPGNSSDDVSGNFGPGGMGITFDTAITVAATTGVADNDTGAPGANEVVVNIFYK